MAPYSMDLRTRVLADWDAGVAAKDLASKFRVSRSWVNRLVQRRRETGEVRPRPQRVFKKQAFAGQEDRLRALVDAKPDQTLAELREALHSSASHGFSITMKSRPAWIGAIAADARPLDDGRRGRP